MDHFTQTRASKPTLTTLPTELLLDITSRLQAWDILSFRRTNRRVFALINHHGPHQAKCIQTRELARLESAVSNFTLTGLAIDEAFFRSISIATVPDNGLFAQWYLRDNPVTTSSDLFMSDLRTFAFDLHAWDSAWHNPHRGDDTLDGFPFLNSFSIWITREIVTRARG